MQSQRKQTLITDEVSKQYHLQIPPRIHLLYRAASHMPMWPTLLRM